MSESNSSNPPVFVVLIGWLWVGVPLAWGIWETINKTLSLFQ